MPPGGVGVGHAVGDVEPAEVVVEVALAGRRRSAASARSPRRPRRRARHRSRRRRAARRRPRAAALRRGRRRAARRAGDRRRASRVGRRSPGQLDQVELARGLRRTASCTGACPRGCRTRSTARGTAAPCRPAPTRSCRAAGTPSGSRSRRARTRAGDRCTIPVNHGRTGRRPIRRRSRRAAAPAPARAARPRPAGGTRRGVGAERRRPGREGVHRPVALDLGDAGDGLHDRQGALVAVVPVSHRQAVGERGDRVAPAELGPRRAVGDRLPDQLARIGVGAQQPHDVARHLADVVLGDAAPQAGQQLRPQHVRVGSLDASR